MAKNTSILETLKDFTTVVKVRDVTTKAVIDSAIFRLHYRITATILFVCCVFVTTYTIFGDPIECVGSIKFKNDDAKNVINTFCFLGYTYTLPRSQNRHENWGGSAENEEEKKYHSYYRWVPLVLFLQGVLFYLPHYIWKNWENKKITHLTDSVRGLMLNIDEDQEKRLKLLAKYFFDSLHTHNVFAVVYYFCETINFINVIFNMYAMDVFLNGEFLKYGLNILNITDVHQENRTDSMIEVFPRITKCDFAKFGPSGTQAQSDFICILALNNLNEKIYIFLWFWLIILACLSLVQIVSNVAVFMSSTIRERKLKKYYILNDESRIKKIVEKSQVGDFFILDLMRRNMNSKCCREFIEEVYDCLIKN